MKKIFLIFMLAFSFASFARPINAPDPEVELFLASEQYQNAISAFDNTLLEKVDVDESTSFFIDNEEKILMITIIFKENNSITHAIRALKVPDEKIDSVGRPYLTMLVKYINFSFEDKSGDFEIYDLDREGIKLGEFEMSSGELSRAAPVGHFCDANHNGDVSFGECVTCMVNACFGSAQCATLCIIGELFARQCWVSIRLSCGWIAMWN